MRPSRAEVEASIQRLNAAGPLKGRLLCADISMGQENVSGAIRLIWRDDLAQVIWLE